MSSKRTKPSSASIISTLQRASFGIATLPSGGDGPLTDAQIAELISKEAKEKEKVWKEYGLGAYKSSPSSSGTKSSGPKLATNKSFLSSMIRSVDGHNQSLLRQQALAARGSQDAAAGRHPSSRDRGIESTSSRGGGSSSKGMRGWSPEAGNNERESDKGKRRERSRSRSRDRDLEDRRRTRDRNDGDEGTSRRRGNDDRDRDGDRPSSSSSRRRRNRDESEDEEAEERRRERRRKRREEERDDGRPSASSRDERSKRSRSDKSPSSSSRTTFPRALSSSAQPEADTPSTSAAAGSSRLALPSRSADRSSTPDAGPSHVPPPSKMDKYFEDSYDPRLDVAPPPKTGMVGEGWERMLDAMKEKDDEKRRARRREKKAAEKAQRKAVRKAQKIAVGFLSSDSSSSEDSDDAKKNKRAARKKSKKDQAREGQRPTWLSEMEQREKGVMEMVYAKKGEERAWDKEKGKKAAALQSDEEEEWEKEDWKDGDILKGFDDKWD